MRTIAVGVMALLATVLPAYAQERSVAAFANLDRQVKEQAGGWNGDKSALSATFNKERGRLGERFEPELLKYIAGDVEKHYWVSIFLEWPGYLHGSKPLPHLSLLIRQQALALLSGKTDEDSVGRTLSLSVLAAIQSHGLGFEDLARSYKNQAELMLVNSSKLRAYFPALSESEIKIYEGLPSSVKRIQSTIFGDTPPERPRTRVSAGVLNSKATTLPLPSYPASLREISGEVVVAVVYDESGNVIWASAVKGPLPLQKPAEDAARKATFPPFTLEGKPEKVYGILIYRFVR